MWAHLHLLQQSICQLAKILYTTIYVKWSWWSRQPAKQIQLLFHVYVKSQCHSSDTLNHIWACLLLLSCNHTDICVSYSYDSYLYICTCLFFCNNSYLCSYDQVIWVVLLGINKIIKCSIFITLFLIVSLVIMYIYAITLVFIYALIIGRGSVVNTTPLFIISLFPSIILSLGAWIAKRIILNGSRNICSCKNEVVENDSTQEETVTSTKTPT